MNDKFSLHNFGPVKSAEVEFGDITFIVGPQASGKSIFLQTWKLTKDWRHVEKTFKDHLIRYSDDGSLIDLYFGLMRGLDKSDKEFTENKNSDSKKQSILYIPAQRTSCMLSNGKPLSFSEYGNEIPFVTKEFSSILHKAYGEFERLSENINLPKNIYNNSEVYIDYSTMGGSSLRMRSNGFDVPFSLWSTGQREFAPISIVLSYAESQSNLKYWIIEEPEMGLHPRAILDFLRQILSLAKHQHKIIISTHSSVFLDFAWGIMALRNTPENEFRKAIIEGLDLNDPSQQKEIPHYLYKIRNNIKTYFFEDGTSQDISNLDVNSDDTAMSEFGELSSFISRMCEIVSKYREE